MNLWKAAWITTGKSDLVPFEKKLFSNRSKQKNSKPETFMLLLIVNVLKKKVLYEKNYNTDCRRP